MRSHNKARLIDITEKCLDPTKSYSIGSDGRLGNETVNQNIETSTVDNRPVTIFAAMANEEKQEELVQKGDDKEEIVQPVVAVKKKDGKFKKSTSK